MEAKDIEILIRKIVRQEVKKINAEFLYFGKVESKNTDGTFNVLNVIDNAIYPSLLNKTNEELNIGDSVTIYAKNNNFGNGYIGIKNGNTNT